MVVLPESKGLIDDVSKVQIPVAGIWQTLSTSSFLLFMAHEVQLLTPTHPLASHSFSNHVPKNPQVMKLIVITKMKTVRAGMGLTVSVIFAIQDLVDHWDLSVHSVWQCHILV